MQTTYILRYNIHYSDNNTNGQESFDTLEQARRYMAKIKKEAHTYSREYILFINFSIMKETLEEMLREDEESYQPQ